MLFFVGYQVAALREVLVADLACEWSLAWKDTDHQSNGEVRFDLPRANGYT